jgi:hypothetical protein
LAHLSEAGPQGEVIAIEHEAEFRLLPDAPPFKARLDLLEVRDDELVITDFKTSRCSWSEQKVRDNLPQIVIYAHAASQIIRDLGVRRVIPRFVVLTKGASPKVQVLKPQASQSDVDRLKSLTADVWNAVQAGACVRREGWQCKGCPFRERCNREATGR